MAPWPRQAVFLKTAQILCECPAYHARELEVSAFERLVCRRCRKVRHFLHQQLWAVVVVSRDRKPACHDDLIDHSERSEYRSAILGQPVCLLRIRTALSVTSVIETA